MKQRTAAIVMALAAACGRGDPAKPTDPIDPIDPIDRPGSAIADALGEGSAMQAPLENLTPDGFLRRGPPTIVIGTRGSDAEDRTILAQARLVRELIPGTTIVPDTSIDVAAGPAAWPPQPLLYGGAHANAVVAALADALPLRVDATQLVVGGQTFASGAERVITVVPAAARHPAFLLYAGTGAAGVVGINGIRHGGEPILIADVHGRLQGGSWERGADGKVIAKLARPAPRIAWRTIERAVAGVPMRVAFPAQLAAAPDEAAVVDTIVRGIAHATTRLQLAAPPPPITIYVYPDHNSKKSLTGDPGDGHALPHTVHVVRFDPKADGPLEGLVAHESTHAITWHLWPAPGSSLLGEGVAVWASGRYRGVSLATWKTQLAVRPPIASLLPMRAFAAAPEGETYPLGGLLVTAAIELVGLDAVRDHLYGATTETWVDACKAAGTTAEALDAALARPLGTHP